MKKHLLLLPCCLLTVSCQGVPSGAPGATSSQLQTVAHSEKNRSSPETIARQITVQVNVGNRRGSGAIIAKRGNRYTILTNAHVANKSNTYQITTPDGKTHPAKCAQPLKQGTCHVEKNHDLALLEFTATEQYTAAEWGDSRNLKAGETIYSAGFPFEQTKLKIDRGQIKLQTSKPLQGGYQIGYDLPTAQGMSGGSLLNANGQLIGIIGLSSEPILDGGYQYQDGSQPTADEVTALRRSSFAIPIATLAKLDTQYTAFLSKPNSGAMARAKYTGVVKRVDDIAEQITVRIEDKNGGNGSGVIVAKEGDTYYVVTAAHVVKDVAAAVVTHSQERIGLSDGEINIVNQDVDVAVVKFKSSQNYRIAEIGKYEFNEPDRVFVSGFPGKDRNKQRHLMIGKVQNRDKTLFVIKDSNEKYGSLSGGINLVYSNLSLPGMSGGAVLDRQGRLVGINTGAENEQIITEKGEYGEINFGYALGIPISTVLGIAQGKIPTAQLQVTTTPTSKLNQNEGREIYEILLSTLIKPSQTASAKEWLDYGNLLWRCEKYRESIISFETAIKLLERSSEISGKNEKLKIAYYGMGLTWLTNNRKSDDKDQKFQPAIKAFQKVINIDPDFFQSWRYLGLSLRKARLYDKSLVAYQTAILKQRNDAVLYTEQGDTFRDLGHYPDAITSYTKAIKLKPNHPWIYSNRGSVYLEQKQYDQAIADFDRAIQLNPQLAMSYSNRGVAYQKQKQYDRAMTDFDRAIQLDPQLAMSYNNRGNAYRFQEQYDRAMADFNRAIQLDSQLSHTYLNRGILYLIKQQYDQAMADFDRAIQLDAKFTDAYYTRGRAYFDKQQYKQAINDYNRAIQLDPTALEIYINRGKVYQKQTQYGKAINDCNRVIQLNPHISEAYELRGIIFAEQGKFVPAIVDLNKAIELNPQEAIRYYHRGLIYARTGEYRIAMADYNRAIQFNPKFATAYLNRGTIYADNKQYSEAMADYNQAIKLNPAFAEVYLNRAITYGRQNQYPQAQADLEKAADLFRAQNNMAGSQKVMTLQEELKSLP